MSKSIILSPSILSADFSMIKEALSDVENSGCNWVHLDVMDGAFVPNITFGSKFIKDIRKHSDLYFDTHLMIDNPERYIKQFAEAGSNCITVHQEACKNLKETIDQIHGYGIKAGVSICPETDVKVLDSYLDSVDLILVMTVRPGFGGQKFMGECLDKVRYLSSVADRKYLISVDGGLNLETAPSAIDAGVDVIVAGSAFFGAEDKKAFKEGLISGR